MINQQLNRGTVLALALCLWVLLDALAVKLNK